MYWNTVYIHYYVEHCVQHNPVFISSCNMVLHTHCGINSVSLLSFKSAVYPTHMLVCRDRQFTVHVSVVRGLKG